VAEPTLLLTNPRHQVLTNGVSEEWHSCAKRSEQKESSCGTLSEGVKQAQKKKRLIKS
jgi:hypothetical protein